MIWPVISGKFTVFGVVSKDLIPFLLLSQNRLLVINPVPIDDVSIEFKSDAWSLWDEEMSVFDSVWLYQQGINPIHPFQIVRRRCHPHQMRRDLVIEMGG